MRKIGSDVGDLVFWGSDCLDCGNTTPDTMECGLCRKTENTTALWIDSKTRSTEVGAN